MRMIVALGLAGLLSTLVAALQPPAPPVAPVPAGTAADPSLEQSLIAARYRQLEDLLLRIAQKMERTGNAENVKKARVIQRALREAREKAIAVNLAQLAEALKKPGLAELKQAVEQGSAVRTDLEKLLLALLADDEDNQDKIKQLQELLKQLDAAIRAQKIANAKNRSESVEAEDAAQAQEIAKLQTEAILAKMKAQQAQGKPKEGAEAQGEPKEGDDKKESGDEKPGADAKDKQEKSDKPGEKSDDKGESGKPGESKENQGEPKESQGKPQEGKPQAGEPKEGQEGESQESQQGQPQQGEQQDEQQESRKRIQDAQDHQQRASDKIKENERQEAIPEQDEATRKLEEARKRLEEILKQMREEEIERVLADLQKRCEVMLQMQEIVLENTRRLFGKIQSLPDHLPTREEEIASRRLSEDEDKIGVEADKAIAIIETEGSAVAFLETFRQLRTDIGHVSRRLNRVNPGPETQLVEEDIVATLKDMIEALKKQQQEQRDRKEQQQQQMGEPPPQSLIDKLAELRMIRALQVRVNQRTKTWANRYTGEQAQDPDILSELRDLGQRQLKIYQITDNLAKGRNQ